VRRAERGEESRGRRREQCGDRNDRRGMANISPLSSLLTLVSLVRPCRFGGETFTARVWVKVVCDETFGYSWKGAESGKNVVRMDAGHTLLLEATLRRDTAEKRKRVMLEDFEWRVADVDLCAGGNYYA